MHTWEKEIANSKILDFIILTSIKQITLFFSYETYYNKRTVNKEKSKSTKSRWYIIITNYWKLALITSTLTDAFGQYNCYVELTESGVYTVKIDYLPDGYDFNGEPQEKTDTYTVRQVTPTDVSFDIIKM